MRKHGGFLLNRLLFRDGNLGRNRAPRNLGEEKTQLMSPLDSIVSRLFRDEKAGRVVVFPGDTRGRGYVVKSEAEESRIRSFMKMFYFAHLSIIILGNFLAMVWSAGLNHELGRPALHIYRAMAIAAGIYFAVTGVPYWLLWRSYKKAFTSFTAGQDEVVVSGMALGQKTWIYIVVGLIAVGVLLAVGLFLVVRAQ
jgi:hypothetical protein